MTDYEPYPVVTFNGTKTYQNNAISSISIQNGRDDVTTQPEPGYANIQLFTDSDTPIDVELADFVEITINKGTTGTQTIFKGTISDIEISIDAYGNTGQIAIYSITAVGPLAQVNRRQVGVSGYGQQFDGNRVYRILTDAFGTEWTDVDEDLTWADVNPTYQWNTYDANQSDYVATLLANIDRPGVYELAAYSGGTTNALSLAGLAADSGRGVLFEAGNGEIYYDDYAARTGRTALALTSNDLLVNGLKSNAQWGEIVNKASVVYSGGTKTASDGESVRLYGQLSGTRSTQLLSAAAASGQAKDFVRQRAYPRTYPEVLTVPLHSPTVSDATRDALCAVVNGLRVATIQLPAVFGTYFDGFVEGYVWNLTRYTAELSLICSAYSETYTSLVWYQITPTTTWAGYTPSTTEWMDL